MTDHRPLLTLVSFLDPPNNFICRKIYDDNEKLFKAAAGSSHNHQAWPGGYLDHVEETMNLAWNLYPVLSQMRPLPFSVHDAMLIMFLHDIEKPWRLAGGVNGGHRVDLDKKEQRAAFRDSLIEEYRMELTPAQANALKYVEGEGDDYSNKERVMNPLAAFCHMCDVWSARGWFDYPDLANDPWNGAARCMTR